MFKKKFLPIEDYGESWDIKTGAFSGNPIFIRYNSSLTKAAGHPEYPYQIGIAVPLLDPTDEGLTTEQEADQLFEIEDRLAEVLEGEAQFVMAITTQGMREFIFYAKKWMPEDFEKRIDALTASKLSHELQFMMQPDPKWKTYKQFL